MPERASSPKEIRTGILTADHYAILLTKWEVRAWKRSKRVQTERKRPLPPVERQFTPLPDGYVRLDLRD